MNRIMKLTALGLVLAAFAAFQANNKEKAEAAARGMTVGQLETFRANLKSKAIAHDSQGMAEVLMPVLRNQCNRLPVGDPGRPSDLVCAKITCPQCTIITHQTP